MTGEEVASFTRCNTEDVRGVIPLADAVIGEMYEG